MSPGHARRAAISAMPKSVSSGRRPPSACSSSTFSPALMSRCTIRPSARPPCPRRPSATSSPGLGLAPGAAAPRQGTFFRFRSLDQLHHQREDVTPSTTRSAQLQSPGSRWFQPRPRAARSRRETRHDVGWRRTPPSSNLDGDGLARGAHPAHATRRRRPRGPISSSSSYSATDRPAPRCCSSIPPHALRTPCATPPKRPTRRHQCPG